MLKLGTFLDVRTTPASPIRDAVNIPLAELADRVCELPAKQQAVLVADTGPDATYACEWLQTQGRLARVTREFELGPSDPVRLWRPNAFLEEVIDQIPVGSAVDLACGSGRDSVFLSSVGFRVTAIDHLEDAIDLGRNLESHSATSGAPIAWKAQDLESMLPEGQFSLAVSFFYLDRRLLAHLSQIVVPGGFVVIETFTVEHRLKFGKPRREKLVLELGELTILLPDFEVIRYEEGLHGDRYTARYLGRRI